MNFLLRCLVLLACWLGSEARLQGCLGCYSTIVHVGSRSVTSAAKKAMRIENAKRLRTGEQALHLVKVLSGQQKRDQGTKFKLTVQVRGMGGIQTYNVDIWHHVKRTPLGDTVSDKYQVSKFEDADASFLTNYEDASESAFVDSGGRDGMGHDNGPKTAQCLCPPAFEAYLCTQQDYNDVVSGKKCDYYKTHKFNTRL